MDDKLKLFKEIVDGWKNLTIKSPQIESMAKKRISICISCPDKKFNDITKRCKVCGCFMPAKTRSEKSKCPLNYW